ncbi:MAG: sugar phosphate isomerase/epimerase [Clostridia bacterium]|nr:sugar phosphate isomerase/epimerase [Clostridia bacterium]
MNGKLPFSVGVITDEVSQSLAVAIEFCKQFGLTALELRSVDGVSPFDWTEAQVKDMKALCDEHGMQVVAISAPLFKCEIGDTDAVANHVASFERLCGFAKILDADLIRGFDFWECGASLEDRAKKYAPIIELCEKYDVFCALEYDPSVHSSDPLKLSEMVNAINHKRIGALYDPGNGLYSDPSIVPYPQGYEALKDRLCHIHVKDAIAYASPKGTEAVRVGEGQVDWHGLFTRLLRDGYDGYVMLETHYRKNVILTEEQLQRPGGYDFSDGAYDASLESMESLLQIIEQARKEVTQS